MESREAAEAFLDAYKRTYDRFYRRIRPTEHQPGREALAVMRHLRLAGPVTVTEAALHFGRSQASASEIFSRMERRGLVAGVPDQRDRRRTLVWLTEEGQHALAGAENVLSISKLERALEQLTGADRAALVSVFERLLETAPQLEGWDDD